MDSRDKPENDMVFLRCLMRMPRHPSTNPMAMPITTGTAT